VLGAGRGWRFEILTDRMPKPLLPVLGRPLVLWQLEALRALGVREVVLVVGHLGDRIREVVGDGAAHGVSVAYVEQAQPLGIAHALACARERLDRPFLCLLGDVFFEAADLARLLPASEGADAVLAVRAEEDPREVAHNFAVDVDGDGWVRAVEEKPRHARAGWKGVGLYLFRPPFLEVVASTPPSALRGERELTEAIQRAVDAGARVRAVTCKGRDFNLNGPADLLAANLHALALSGQESWIDAGAEVEDGARVAGSVVLAGARIARGARLERVLVLPGERVPPGEHREVVFAAGEAIPAREQG
jgi:NDP-sugar pyrophosphorylase family protein